MSLPAFAAARRAAAAPWPCSYRWISISPTRRALSSKPAARCCSRRTGQTDGWTDRWKNGRTPCRYINPALHTTRALPTRQRYIAGFVQAPVYIDTGVGNNVTLRNFPIIFIIPVITVFCKEFTYQQNLANKIAVTKNSQLRRRAMNYGMK